MTTEFKIGDKVVKKSGNSFYSGARMGTVVSIEPRPDPHRSKVWIKESDSWIAAGALTLAKTGEEPKVQTGTIQADISTTQMLPHSLQHFSPVVDGVGPDAPIVYNEQGGGQSASPYRLDLVDPKALLDISKVLKEGADKYGENNWKKISINDHLNHLLVHIYAHLAGDASDKHLAHAACRAIFALGVELEENK